MSSNAAQHVRLFPGNPYIRVILSPIAMTSAPFRSSLNKQLLFVQGKGGVGKSTLALAVARLLSESHRTLLISIEDPLREPYEMRKLNPQLDHINNEATAAFEEYAGKKIGAPKLVKIFLNNRFMRYVVKAAPVSANSYSSVRFGMKRGTMNALSSICPQRDMP